MINQPMTRWEKIRCFRQYVNATHQLEVAQSLIDRWKQPDYTVTVAQINEQNRRVLDANAALRRCMGR